MKTLLQLAKSYDFKNENEYFDYIKASSFCGQPQQVRSLYYKMPEHEQENFINESLNYETQDTQIKILKELLK